MGFIKKHPILVSSLSFILQLPGAIEGFFSLFDRFNGGEPVAPVINWLTFIPAIIGLGLLITVIVIVTRRPSVEIYLTRTDLSSRRGAFDKEFKNTKKIWAIWSSGAIISSGGNLDKVKIERLILTSPDNSFLMEYMEPMSDTNKKAEHILHYKYVIRKTAEMAYKSGCEVRFYNGPVKDSINIADSINLKDNSFSDDSWIRIETGAPFIETENRINIVLKKKKNEDAFNALIKHYETVWNRSDPYVPDKDYGYST